MSLETLIDRLDCVRETGYGKYVARCPAHDDKSPSLAIKECGDGRILLHCFSLCETEDVLSALGLTFADVMPERVGEMHTYKPVRQRFDARQVLAGLSHEVMVVCLIADRLAGVANDVDQSRLLLAGVRLNTALDISRSLGTPPEIKKIRRGES